MPGRDERLDAAIFAAAGATILVASWRMDRLTDRGIEAWSAPGLMPGLLGALMLVLALALAWRARRGTTPAEAGADPDEAPDPGGAARTALALLLCVAFAGLTLGHGWPFAVEGAVFVFVFTTCFSWADWRARGHLLRGLAQTAAVAVVASALIAWLFESVFLVRLP